jgi:hypothetical protein
MEDYKKLISSEYINILNGEGLVDTLTEPTGEIGKAVAITLKDLTKNLDKDSFLGKTLSGLTDGSTTTGETLNNLFKALEKGESIGPAISGIAESSKSARDILTRFKDELDKSNNKVEFYTSDEAIKMLHNYNRKYKIVAYNDYEQEVIDKLLDISVPYKFDFSSPMKHRYITKITTVTNDIKDIKLSDILNDYLTLILISENRFTELCYFKEPWAKLGLDATLLPSLHKANSENASEFP